MELFIEGMCGFMGMDRWIEMVCGKDRQVEGNFLSEIEVGWMWMWNDLWMQIMDGKKHLTFK